MKSIFKHRFTKFLDFIFIHFYASNVNSVSILFIFIKIFIFDIFYKIWFSTPD